MYRRWSLIVFALILAASAPIGARAEIAEIAYSFGTDDGGGAAMVRVDSKTGKIVGQRVLFRAGPCTTANKVRRTADGQTIVVTNETEDGPHLYLISRRRAAQPRPIRLRDMPDEVRIAGDHALVTCADDSLALVDLRQGEVAATWKADKELDPPGNAPEDVFIVPDSNYAVVSFQKDSKKGKKFGSRLAVLQLPSMELVSDIRLPRTHPELHIAENLKEQGPSPEIVLVSEPADTLFVTLDLYGAVALMDWSAMKAGALSNCTYLPTSEDGSWGSAFPDRATLFTLGKRPVVLACNAGSDGGAVLVDIRGRRILKKWGVPAGLEKPVFMPRLQKAFASCAGKTKYRDGSELKKTYHPAKSIFTFDFSPGPKGRRGSLEEFPTDLFVIRLAAVAPDRCPLFIVAAGAEPEDPDRLLTFDPEMKQLVDSAPALGTIGQFEG